MPTVGIFYILVIISACTWNGHTRLTRVSETNKKPNNGQAMTKATIQNRRLDGETVLEIMNSQRTKSNKGAASARAKIELMKSGKEMTNGRLKMKNEKSMKEAANEQIKPMTQNLNRMPNFQNSFFLRDLSRGDREAMEDFLRYHTLVDTPFDILRQFLGIQDNLAVNQIPDFSDVLGRLIVHEDNLSLAGKTRGVGDGRSQGLFEITFNKQARENFITNLQREHSALRTGPKFMKFLTQLRNAMHQKRQPEFLDFGNQPSEKPSSLNELSHTRAISNLAEDLPNDTQRFSSGSIAFHDRPIEGHGAEIQKFGRFTEFRDNITKSLAEQNIHDKVHSKPLNIVQPDDKRVLQFIDNILARENAVNSNSHNTTSPSGSEKFKHQQIPEGITDPQAGTGDFGNNRGQNKTFSNSKMSTHTGKINKKNKNRAKDFSESNTASPKLSSSLKGNTIPTRPLVPQKSFHVEKNSKTTESMSSSKISISPPESVKSQTFDIGSIITDARSVTTRSPASGVFTKILHWPPTDQKQKLDFSRFAVSAPTDVATVTPKQVPKVEKVSLPPADAVSQTTSNDIPKIITKIIQWPNYIRQRLSYRSPTVGTYSTTPSFLPDTLVTSNMFSTTQSPWLNSIVKPIVSGLVVHSPGKVIAETTRSSRLPQANIISATVNRDRNVKKYFSREDRRGSAGARLIDLGKRIKIDRNKQNFIPVEVGRLNKFILPNVTRISTMPTTVPAKIFSSFGTFNSVQSPRPGDTPLWDTIDLAWLDFFTKVWCDDSVFSG